MYIACIKPNVNGPHRQYAEMDAVFTRSVKRKIQQSFKGLYNNQYLFNLRMVHKGVDVSDAALEGFSAAIMGCIYGFDIRRFNVPFFTMLGCDNDKELMETLLKNEDSGDIAFIAGPYSENQAWNVFFECALMGDTLLAAHEQFLDFSFVGDKISPPEKVQRRMNNIIGSSIIRKNNLF